MSFRSHHHILAICGIANLLAPRHYSGRLCWAHSEAAGVTVFVPFKESVCQTRTIPPCGSTRTSSGNCQETETCLVQACHTPRQLLQNHPLGHLGGWATPWSAEKMLDGHYQRVDIPAHCTAAHKGLLQKRLEEDLCWIVPRVLPTIRSGKGLNWTELCAITLVWKHHNMQDPTRARLLWVQVLWSIFWTQMTNVRQYVQQSLQGQVLGVRL